MTENKDKIILDLCGGTGSWSRPYKEAGKETAMKNIDVIKNMSSKELAQFMHDITMLCEFQKCTACPILRNGYCEPEAWLNDVYLRHEWQEYFIAADDAVAHAKGGQP